MKTAFHLLLLCVLSFIAVSCMSVPKTMPEDLTSAKLIQQAQEYLDLKNYKAAAFVYETLIERFGSDIDVYATARFEIAHIYIKQKKWKESYAILKELDGLYSAGDVQGLPTEYGKLVRIDLEKIPERYKTETEVAQ